MSQLIAHSLDDIPFVSKSILEQLGHRKVVAFHAEMGAGKTTLISGMLRAMGIEELEGSPTYSIVNSYFSPYYGEVFHFDLYRLNSLEEAMDAGVEEMLYSGALCLVEWPDIVEPLLPDERLDVSIKVSENGDRVLTVTT